MQLTAEQAIQIKETHETMIKLAPMIKDHHNTLYGNGQKGLVKDHLTFKTQVKTALTVISVVFAVAIAVMKLLK